MLYDYETIMEVGKELSIVKRENVDPETRVALAEINVLTGYRNLPVPGYDFNKDVYELINAGNQHGWNDQWNELFSQVTQDDEGIDGKTSTSNEFHRIHKIRKSIYSRSFVRG